MPSARRSWRHGFRSSSVCTGSSLLEWPCCGTLERQPVMTTFPGSPQLLKGGIVLLDPATSQPVQVIVLQYNPDTLTRTLQLQGIGPEPGDRLEALRLKGPPLETIKLDAEIDATDQMEAADSTTSQLGIYPQLA